MIKWLYLFTMFLWRFSWLEIAEYISLFCTFISLIIFFLDDQFIWLGVFLFISLILSAINRYRLEIRTRARIAGALKVQLKKFSEQINEIKEKLNYSWENSPQLKSPQRSFNQVQSSDNVVIASLQQDLDTLDQSISSVVNYINKYLPHKGIESLDQKYQTLAQKIAEFIPENNISKEDKWLDSDSNGDDFNVVSNNSPSDLQDDFFSISWECLHFIDAHSQAVTGLAISDDNKCLVSVSWDQTLRLWSVEDGTLMDKIEASDQGLLVVTAKKFRVNEPDSCGYCIATGSFDQNVKIWSLRRDRKDRLMISLEHTLTGHNGSIHGLGIGYKNGILVSGSYDQSLKQWDLETGKLLESSYDQSGSIYAIAIHEQGEFIASAGGDGSITIWSLGRGERLSLLTGNIVSVESLAISRSGEIIAAGCVDGTIKLWYLPEDIFTTEKEINPSFIIPAHNGQVMSLLFSSDGQILYSGAVDGFIKIWYCQTGQELGHLTISDENRVFSLALSNDGNLLAAGGMDGKIKIWRYNP